MPLIIDAYNVLHAAGIELQELIQRIAAGRHGRQTCHLVCDGRPRRGAPNGRIGRAVIHYAGTQHSADDVIIRMVEASTHPRELTIVSSDQAIVRAVRRRRCKSMRSDVFLRQLDRDQDAAAVEARRRSQPRRPAGRLSGSEVQAELDRFGLRADEVESAERERRAGPRRSARGSVGPAAGRGRAETVKRAEKPVRAANPVEAELAWFGISAEEVRTIEQGARGQSRSTGAKKPHAGSKQSARSGSDEPGAKAKPRGAKNHGEPMPVLPPELIEQAEELWRED